MAVFNRRLETDSEIWYALTNNYKYGDYVEEVYYSSKINIRRIFRDNMIGFSNSINL